MNKAGFLFYISVLASILFLSYCATMKDVEKIEWKEEGVISVEGGEAYLGKLRGVWDLPNMDPSKIGPYVNQAIFGFLGDKCTFNGEKSYCEFRIKVRTRDIDNIKHTAYFNIYNDDQKNSLLFYESKWKNSVSGTRIDAKFPQEVKPQSSMGLEVTFTIPTLEGVFERSLAFEIDLASNIKPASQPHRIRVYLSLEVDAPYLKYKEVSEGKEGGLTEFNLGVVNLKQKNDVAVSKGVLICNAGREEAMVRIKLGEEFLPGHFRLGSEKFYITTDVKGSEVSIKPGECKMNLNIFFSSPEKGVYEDYLTVEEGVKKRSYVLRIKGERL